MIWRPRSLQARMFLLSVVALFGALAIAGWAITGVLERFVMTGIDRRLDSEIALLATAIDADGRVDRDRLQRQSGAFESGPGWRWRIVTPDGVVGSEDFPALDDPPHGPPRPDGPPDRGDPHDRRSGPRPREGEERGVRVHARELVMPSARGDVRLLAAAPRSTIASPIMDAIVPLLAALAALATLLAVGTIVQIRVGLRPLRRLRDQVAAIRIGNRAAVDEQQPTELRPLAIELNALTRDNQAALAAARLSAANLAHALKTPVATLALYVRSDPARAAQVARIDATIRHHLARARLETVDHRASTALAPAVADLVATIQRLRPDRPLSIEQDVPPDIDVAMDPHDLDELLGNLLDNAAKHAASCISIGAVPSAEDRRMVRIEIVDDGPGIPLHERERVAAPGMRLDEQGDGHGFGLSIVSEMLSLYGGRMSLDTASAGGLAVRIWLPLSYSGA